MNILHRSHARLPHRRLPYFDTDNKNREHVSYLVSIPSPMSIATFQKHQSHSTNVKVRMKYKE